jgi:arylsulfatase A-like enzyme
MGRQEIASGANARPASARPNIVVIMFDDLSPRIRALGDPVAHTPALDRFAGEAVHYPNTFTTSPVCAPSRSALMTGVHQQTLGTMHMRTRGAAGLRGGGPIEYDAVPPAQVKAFPELLRAAGYHTVNIGKFDYQFGEPFTMWDDAGPSADWRRRPGDRPFLAVINLQHTHESYLWPEETTSQNRLVQLVSQRNRRDFANKVRRTDPAAVVVPPYLPDTPVVRQDLARLYDNLSFDDQNVQRIMDALRADGVLDNTIVVVTSDHGDGLPRVKRAIHASGLRVPLLVPGLSASSIWRRRSCPGPASRRPPGCRAIPSRRPGATAMSSRPPTDLTSYRNAARPPLTAAFNIFAIMARSRSCAG